MPSEAISGAANFYSYNAIEMYMFLGFTPQLTKLRRHLKLPAWPNPSTAPAHSITNLKIPFTYMWSPSLQPKPSDWGGQVDVRSKPPYLLELRKIHIEVLYACLSTPLS